MPVPKPTQPIKVPTNYPSSVVYIDESGGMSTRFFVVAAVKVRRHGEFSRALQGVRERNHFYGEFKFSTITQGSLPRFYDVVDCLAQADVTFAATIVDRTIADPRAVWKEDWEARGQLISSLLCGCINRVELVSVCMDHFSTPSAIGIEDNVQQWVNRRLKQKAVISAVTADSKSHIGLQVVDCLAGAIALDARRRADPTARINAHKAKVADRIMERFNLDQFEGRTARTNVVVHQGPRTTPRRTSLRVVPTVRRPSGLTA